MKNSMWIDVKKEKPKLGQKVIIYKHWTEWECTQGTKYCQSYKIATYVRSSCDGRRYTFVEDMVWRRTLCRRLFKEYDDVTHWMPLPAPPEVK